MNYFKAKTKDFYLKTTEVENLFINEFMSDAPSDFVKVYLFALLYAQHSTEITHQMLAKQLRLDEKTVANAWEYWERLGVVKKIPNGDRGPLSYDVEFVDLREKMYGMRIEEAVETKSAEDNRGLKDKTLKEIFDSIESIKGDLLNSNELKEIAYWVQDLNCTREVAVHAYRYCYDIGKNNINYVAKVVEDWVSRGFITEEDCDEFIEQHQERQERYRKILNSLGIFRQPTEPEKKLMRTWFEEWGFELDKVMEAVNETSGTTNPSIKYLSKILESWYKEAKEEDRNVNQRFKVSQATLNQYLQSLRDKEEKEARLRKEEIYAKLPKIKEIDFNIRGLSSDISRNLLSGNRSEIEKFKNRMRELESERAVLLTDNNYRSDYTEIKYACELCKDTGIGEDGLRCSCLEIRMKEAEVWQAKTNFGN